MSDSLRPHESQHAKASLSITNSRSSLKLTSIESVMPSSHLILRHPLFLLPLIPPSIRVFSNESTLCMRWPKDWSFSFSISPSKEHPGLISGMLNSPATVLLWISSFVSVKICFLYLVGCVCVCVCVCIHSFYIFLLDQSVLFFYYVMTFLVSCDGLYFKVCLVWYVWFKSLCGLI